MMDIAKRVNGLQEHREWYRVDDRDSLVGAVFRDAADLDFDVARGLRGGGTGTLYLVALEERANSGIWLLILIIL